MSVLLKFYWSKMCLHTYDMVEIQVYINKNCIENFQKMVSMSLLWYLEDKEKGREKWHLLEVGEGAEEVRGGVVVRGLVEVASVEALLDRRESDEENKLLFGG